ncbi:Phospholipid ABC transporter shuttle protein MlaC [hydrothermal vent metagenome]|uniref:Phospholipid ABC transporter shuttle protein MlaC n=1 Tax=hydrothermal vent metagenome TaxID=652676 RepID=A0A3B0WWJ6_9ZZZZ
MKKLVLFLLLMHSTLSFAAAVGPDELIKQTSEKVLSALEENKEKYKDHPEEIFKLVNDIILPHLDFRAMSKLALGKNWRKANKDQQGRFVEAFKTMLIRTYSKSLTEYAGQEIQFLPYRPPAEGKRTTKVKTVIDQGTGPDIPIIYSLRIKDDIWKVYDIKIDGISLVTNYRNSFASDIRKVGIDGLIEQLQAKSAGKVEKA